MCSYVCVLYYNYTCMKYKLDTVKKLIAHNFSSYITVFKYINDETYYCSIVNNKFYCLCLVLSTVKLSLNLKTYK